jgi:hypothetical protein
MREKMNSRLFYIYRGGINLAIIFNVSYGVSRLPQISRIVEEFGVPIT